MFVNLFSYLYHLFSYLLMINFSFLKYNHIFDSFMLHFLYFNHYVKKENFIMGFGINNRLSRIIKPKTGKTVMLAVDHGYFQGPTTGLRDLKKTVTPLIPHTDCLFITRGMVRNCIDPRSDVSVCLRVSGGPSILGELSNEYITTSL